MKRFFMVFLSVVLLCSTMCGCGPSENNGDVQEYVVGTITEDGWQSRWIGLQYRPADNVVMAGRETLDRLSGGDDGNIVYEMQAKNVSKNIEMILYVEHLADPETTVTEYLETVKSRVRDSLPDPTFSAAPSKDLGGIGFTRMNVETTFKETYLDWTVYSTYMVAKKDDRMVVMLINASPAEVDTMLAGFTAYTG